MSAFGRYCLATLLASALALAGCAQGSRDDAGGQSEGSAAFSNVSEPGVGSGAGAAAGDGAQPDEVLLAEIMGADDADKLLEGAQDNADRYWIASHPEALGIDGETVQAKLLRLAADEDDAVKYVRDFPERYAGDGAVAGGVEGGAGAAARQDVAMGVAAGGTAAGEDGDAGLTGGEGASSANDRQGGAADDPDSNAMGAATDAASAAADASPAANGPYPSVAVGLENVPHLYQWDQRWGYVVYSSTAFGLTGCGPTSLAMAYQGVTGKRDLSPSDMAQLAQDMGYMAEYDGTDPALFIDIAEQLGMYCESIEFTEDALRNVFEQGGAVIANPGNGYFSNFGGHFLVLTGFAPDGKLAMNDPYSAVRSRQTWDPDFIFGECMALYAFWKL